jgi:hypothetical protein
MAQLGEAGGRPDGKGSIMRAAYIDENGDYTLLPGEYQTVEDCHKAVQRAINDPDHWPRVRAPRTIGEPCCPARDKDKS